MKHTTIGVLLFVVGIGAAHAGAAYDGSMGTQGTLAGNFTVPATAGKIQANNLFHSFSRFDILTAESATFTGPNSISTIISRVTGGSISTINGLLDSATAMPNANFYFINSAGIVFNANAKVHVGGTFFASTANTINMADTLNFSSVVQVGEVFSSAAPVSFGFLTGNIGSIQINGAKLAGTTQVAFSNLLFTSGVLPSLSNQINAAFTGATSASTATPFTSTGVASTEKSPENSTTNSSDNSDDSSTFSASMNARVLDASRWVHRICQANDTSSFNIQTRDAQVHTPDDWQVSPMLF